jgi:hypothetical protein
MAVSRDVMHFLMQTRLGAIVLCVITFPLFLGSCWLAATMIEGRNSAGEWHILKWYSPYVTALSFIFSIPLCFFAFASAIACISWAIH